MAAAAENTEFRKTRKSKALHAVVTAKSKGTKFVNKYHATEPAAEEVEIALPYAEKLDGVGEDCQDVKPEKRVGSATKTVVIMPAKIRPLGTETAPPKTPPLMP